MRAASAMSAVATPRSAARAGSGTITSSGRSSEADEEMLPRPGMRAQVALQRLRRFHQAVRVVAGQHQLHQLARLGADVADARAGQVGQARARLALEFLLAALALVHRAPVQHQRGLARLADAGLGRVADVDACRRRCCRRAAARGCRRSFARACSASATVSCRRVPGGSSSGRLLRPRSEDGNEGRRDEQRDRHRQPGTARWR